jgi:N-acetylglucosaminyldiphosphoundecaprenol N-acetyl-beta-D-mannosaminyltransferase
MSAADPTTQSRVDGPFICCGVPITPVGPAGARDLLLGSAHGHGRAVHLCNAYTLSLAVREPEFRAVLAVADLNFADGQPVAALGRKRGHAAMSTRVYGPDLMLAVMDEGRVRGLRHYLYGGTSEVVGDLQVRLRLRYPGVEVVGVESPPFRELTPTESAAMVQRVRTARPDIVWVGLGTPRQDHFVASYAAELQSTLVAVGAAFDFHAGHKRQAPAWMQRVGLEWLFRLATEPRRLWRRYLVGNPVFLFGIARDAVVSRRRS